MRKQCKGLCRCWPGVALFYILISRKAAFFELYICTLARLTCILLRALCLILMNEDACVFFCRHIGREVVFSLHVSWGLCFCECCLGCVCLSEGKRDRKKCAFHSSEADIFTNCLAVWAFWPLNTWITHFRRIWSIHVDIPAVCLWVCPCAPVFACSRRTDEIASPPPLPPPSPPPNVISLPLGPWQTHQTGRK